MQKIHVYIRSFFKKGNNNLIKITSLGIGLAMGLVLIAKVYFEQSYDSFFPDKEDIYRIMVNYKTLDTKEGEEASRGYISGGVAVGMKEMIPEVEVATRYTGINGNGVFFTEDRKKISSNTILADSCLFDVFQLPMLSGVAKEVLSRPMYALISRKIAENMGGISQAVGQTIQFDNFPGKAITIGGVFENIPANSHMQYNLVLSLASISQFMGDGSMGWVGNDRYSAYIKVIPNANPENFGPQTQIMKEKYLPLDRLKEAGVSIDYSFLPLQEVYSGDESVQQRIWLLLLLACAILFTAIMNYVLIVISSLVNRSKEMAVHKCYGASPDNIRSRMLMEAFIDTCISLLVAVLLIFAFRGAILDLLNTHISDLFTSGSILLLAGICVIIVFVSGLIPGYLFGRIPVAVAFRNYREDRRIWKLALLFVQFIGTGLLITMLVFIIRQYNFMINDNPGYEYKNLAYCDLAGIDNNIRQRAMDEIERLAEVSDVTTFSTLPFYSASGNNIGLPGDNRDLFNIADLYYVGNDYLNIMEIPIIEGRYFQENVSTSDEVMVSRSFIEKIMPYTNWTDGIVGKSITISYHSENMKPFTICGVFEEFRIGSINWHDTRPGILFYATTPANYLLIKFHDQTPEAVQRISDILTELMPTKDIHVYSFPTEMVNRYSGSRQFRDQVMIGGIVSLIICLIGLIGYTNNEMNRRRKEMAIRRVNGVTISDTLRLFMKDILRIALPALLFGGIGAYFVLNRWLEQFSDKVGLSPIIFILSGLVVLLIIMFSVCTKSYFAAIENPAKNIKSE